MTCKIYKDDIQNAVIGFLIGILIVILIKLL